MIHKKSYKRKIVIIFLTINLSMSHWDSSFEYPQRVFDEK